MDTRARGALYGLAIGDALGMPTQSLSRERIVARYGARLTGFAPGEADQPIAPNMRAGSVTDDTEQAVLVGRLLVDGGGHIAPTHLASELLAWEKAMAARGSLDLLGPSTKRAVAAVAAGVPVAETGRYGDTNGAAMRVAPVGIAVPGEDLPALVDRVVEASAVSHNTGVALAAASAVAAAVSAGLEGATVELATRHAIDAARLGARRGYWIAGADIATRIAWATALVGGLPADVAAERIYQLVGTSVHSTESVPAAFAVLSVYPDDPWQAVLLAASLGGDCDTIAAMAGAIAGAVHGIQGFPTAAVDTVRDINQLDLDRLAGQLLELRGQAQLNTTKV
ncbi:ADP-ribosylglycohydrolase family protein [Rugosimonospora acidiphila]|uniref:ADP-ribosylglycohydrolase family protein n=2 Tax=Rugosimonospora acidiphila TaxID=556531 RepID=A0ABP9SN36_9ACTN